MEDANNQLSHATSIESADMILSGMALDDE